MAAEPGRVTKQDTEDRIAGKLPALHFYQLSLPVPKPPAGASSPSLLPGAAKCFSMVRHVAPTCHVPPLFTEPGWNLHKKLMRVGIDDFQAKRGPDDRYVTAKLRLFFRDQKKIHKGGFYHDGRFATLNDVVNHYDNHFRTSLTEQEKADLIEYLKSI